ncbi:MAG: hypothetical protein MI922_20615, partial [Bacteroidales bacterium]|nr:hypothetical protein [Bacteroidales bacterium]
SVVFEKTPSNKLKLTYKDNGKGFDYLETRRTSKGYGLINIRNRVLTFNGDMNFETGVDKGVLVTIELNTE